VTTQGDGGAVQGQVDVSHQAPEGEGRAHDRCRGAVVECSELCKRFGEGTTAVEALAGVTLSFPRAELTAIVGPSGSGKSTLMHVLAGLDRATSGQAWIDGEEVTGLDDRGLTRLRREKLGFIFQFFNLVPVLTAEQNIALPVRIAGRRPDPDWLEALLKTVGLSERRDHRPAELSGGEQQRVAVARALISRPAVVFADEPTGNLDSRAGAGVLELLRGSVEQLDQTVIMVTHDPRVASRANRLVVLKDGRVSHEGSLEDPDDAAALMHEA
jgi:putative ABC transport system ATP-binding protein